MHHLASCRSYLGLVFKLWCVSVNKWLICKQQFGESKRLPHAAPLKSRTLRNYSIRDWIEKKYGCKKLHDDFCLQANFEGNGWRWQSSGQTRCSFNLFVYFTLYSAYQYCACPVSIGCSISYGVAILLVDFRAVFRIRSIIRNEIG